MTLPSKACVRPARLVMDGRDHVGSSQLVLAAPHEDEHPGLLEMRKRGRRGR